jgi:hypothetical protein
MRVAPDAASYAALLDGYALVPDPGAARKLLDEMHPRGRLAPTSLAQCISIDVCYSVLGACKWLG